LPVFGRKDGTAYGWVIRPLLQVTRRETEACSASFGFGFPGMNPYNIDPAYLRNRIRYQLLPWLRDQANPNIKKSIGSVGGPSGKKRTGI